MEGERSERVGTNYLLEVRPVSHQDTERMAVLYGRLNSCNGNPAVVGDVIQTSNMSFKRAGDRFTFVADAHFFDEKGEFNKMLEEDVVGTGSLIRKGVTPGNGEGIPMYKEYSDGKFQLDWDKENMVEMGAMVVSPRFEGGYVGKSLTTARALIARVFSGSIGVNTVIAEFLPQYDEDGMNAFFRDVILQFFVESGSVEELKKELSRMLNKVILGDADLFKALSVDLNSVQRSQIVKKYFPVNFERGNLSEAANSVIGSIGSQTVGARKNLQGTYGPVFKPVGYFPVDAGSNYTAPLMYGALGNVTKTVDFMSNTDLRACLHNPSSHRALVYTPLSGRMTELREFYGVVSPIIVSVDCVRVPDKVGELLKVEELTDDVSYVLLPPSSKPK